MQGRKNSTIRLEIHDDTCATLAGWLRRQKPPVGLANPASGRCCCWQTGTALQPPPDRLNGVRGMSANGRCALRPLVSRGYTTNHVRAASPFFPPAVALSVVKLACERPDVIGRSLSQWESTELARQLVRDGVKRLVFAPDDPADSDAPQAETGAPSLVAVADCASACRIRSPSHRACHPLHAPFEGMGNGAVRRRENAFAATHPQSTDLGRATGQAGAGRARIGSQRRTASVCRL